MRYKALVVDDQESVRTLLARILEDEGYDVAQASNGVDGLRRVRVYQPHLVITNHDMPGMKGAEMVRDLRDKESFTGKICMMSGNPDLKKELPHYGIPQGREAEFVDAFIEKPFRVQEFRAMLSGLFSGQPR